MGKQQKTPEGFYKRSQSGVGLRGTRGLHNPTERIYQVWLRLGLFSNKVCFFSVSSLLTAVFLIQDWSDLSLPE